MQVGSPSYKPQPVYPEVTPPVHRNFQSLRITAPEMTDDDYVEIQCEGAAPDDEGRIQWYFNGRLLDDEAPLYPRGKTLHIRPISRPYLGRYRCSIPGDNYRDGKGILTFSQQPVYNVPPVFNPSSPLTIDEGESQVIRSPSDYDRAYWSRSDGQELPSNIYQIGNDLLISNARSDHSGTYHCQLYKQDGIRKNITYEIQVRHSQRPEEQIDRSPKILIQQQSINLKEGQRMSIQYTITSEEPVQILWSKFTGQGYEPISSLFTVEANRLILHRATPDSAGIYQIIARNLHGETREKLVINVKTQLHQDTGDQQQEHQDIKVTVHPKEITVEAGEKATATCHVEGAQKYQVIWGRYAHDTSLPDYAHQQGNHVIITPPANAPPEQTYFQCQVNIPGHTEPYHAYASVNIRI
ncbi:hypothetical protein I4U23_023161 [Adineta vaga]|nr:hypothetical protein I4U23_023161 [Adineta vaga]